MGEISEPVEEGTVPAGIDGFTAAAVRSTDQAAGVIGRLFDVAQPNAIFGKPVVQGQYMVITASEVAVGMGIGFGVGGDADEEGGDAGGGGGGGGGASMGRPVAAILIGPDGVRVEPIVDPTKIAIAFFTTIGAMFVSWRAIRKAAR